MLLPFFTQGIVSKKISVPVVALIGASLWPHAFTQINITHSQDYFPLLARELFIGLVLGIVFAMPFWIMHGIGSIIDNQRGATISSTLDPITGIDTSELANLFNLFAAALFLQGGGLVLIMETISKSYQLCDPLLACTPALRPSFELLTTLMSKVIILSSPVLGALLLSEMTLGLLSRFAPQMNAFSISLTIKSVVAFFILILYFSPVLPGSFQSLWFHPEQMHIWFNPAKAFDAN